MRLLVDTQAILWWLMDSERLGPQARRKFMSDDLVLSPIVLWEIAIKASLKKLTVDVAEVCAALANENLERLGFTDEDMIRVSTLEQHHRDPFDRMLIAQAMREDIPVLTADGKFELYEVQVIDAQK